MPELQSLLMSNVQERNSKNKMLIFFFFKVIKLFVYLDPLMHFKDWIKSLQRLNGKYAE